MHKNSHEIPSNELPSNTDVATVYPRADEQDPQRQTRSDQTSDELPPPYDIATESSPHPIHAPQPKVQVQHVIQTSSINNERPLQTSLLSGYRWPRRSINVVCPVCHATVDTRVETSTTILTWLLAALLFCFCFCLAIIPFCFSSCKKTIHFCPRCGAMLGEVDEFQ